MKLNRSIIHGLVLTGGASSRMGQDKSLLHYGHRTRPEVLRMRDVLQPYCAEIYAACHPRKIQHAFFNPLPDYQALCGPMGGLVTAFRFRPHVPWLLLPCDMPLLQERVIEQLTQTPKKGTQAVCFRQPNGKFQPLPSLWFPSAAPLVYQSFEQGRFSLWRALQRLNTQILDMENAAFLESANTPDERRLLQARLLKTKSASMPPAD